MKKILLLSIIVFSFASFTPKDSWFCACCGERGQYDVRDEVISDYLSSILNKIKFDTNAELYTVSGFEDTKGLNAIKTGYEANDWQQNPYYFTSENEFTANTWNLNFKTQDGKTGALILPVPKKMVSFKIDTHDTPEGNEVALYKEFRFKGSIKSGNGFFSSGLTSPATYFLVLQGRGNNCDNPEDYTNWRLDISGANANYSFIGKLK